MSSLGTELPVEMTRVRDEILPEYDAFPSGRLAAAMMRKDLDDAARAMIEGNVGEMIRCYRSLKEYSL